MAATTVFIDDAVLGRLPSVCAKDGVWTSDRLTFTKDVGAGKLGVAWLLVLLGPIGWIILILIAATRGVGPPLTVTLPLSEAAYLRMEDARRGRRRASLVALGAFLGAFVALLPRTLDLRLLALVLAVVACGAAVRAVFESVRFGRATVGVDLDASHRWVLLSGVHPDFAAAVEIPGHDRQSAPHR